MHIKAPDIITLSRALILLFVFSIPWEEMVVIPGVGTLTKVCGALSALSLVLYMAIHKRVYWHIFFSFGFAFVVFSWLSLFWSIDRSATFARVATYTQLFVAVFLIFQIADRSLVKQMMVAFSLGCWVLVLGTFHQYMLGIESHHERYSAPGTNPNTLAAAVALSIPMALVGLRQSVIPLWLYSLLIALVPAGLVTISLTGSRTGFVLMMLTLFALVVYLAGLARGVRWKTVAFWGLTYGILISLTPMAAMERGFGAFHELISAIEGEPTPVEVEGANSGAVATEVSQGQSGVSVGEPGTLSSRTDIWGAGWDVFLENRWLGVGAGAFGSSVAEALEERQSPHSVYLGVLVEGGVVGLALWLLMMSAALFSCRSIPSDSRLFMGLLLFMLFLLFLVGNAEWRKVTWLLMMLPLVFTKTEGAARQTSQEGAKA